jgi:hypothetical protein
MHSLDSATFEKRVLGNLKIRFPSLPENNRAAHPVSRIRSK